MKLTRRELAAALAAQAPAPSRGEPREAHTVRDLLDRSAAALDRFDLPMETEPDFQFKP